ncbi:MAG: hypothetical protein EA424_01320 [Planctomycetaceae bacterium]|nr:MAG: hypothetical protein EA424_01320 [Planctomycetaceae bacterium]
MVSGQLEERVASLEREFAVLKQLAFCKGPERDWRSTFGMFAGDSGFDDVLRLGREFRQREGIEDRDDARA